jgi:hypothetical protein
MTDDLIYRADALAVFSDGEANWAGLPDQIRAIPAAKPKVKALVWEKRSDGERYAIADAPAARTLYIAWKDGVVTRDGDSFYLRTDNPEAAMAAAQADHEARILSALEGGE